MSGAVRNFLVMFFLFLLIFGICGHFIATELIPSMINDGDEDSFADSESVMDSQTEESIPENNNESKPVVSGATYTFAFLCLGPEDELVSVYLMHVNEGYKSCVSASIPAYSATEVGGSTLNEIYKFKGSDFLIKKLQYLTGFVVDDHATLYTVDIKGNGHTVTALSNRLGYRYRINDAFKYPNPLYEGDIVGEESEEVSEEVDISGDDDDGEYFTIEPNSYALNGITNGLNNYSILLDPEWNPNAHEIFQELFKRIFDDKEICSNVSEQNSIMNFMENETFSSYTNSTAAKYLFKYKNQHFECECQRISDWDNVKNTILAKEQGENE